MELDRGQKIMLAKFSAYGLLKNLRFFEPLILLYFTVAKGLSYTQFGVLIGVREVAIYLLEIPTGILADMTGRRRVMAASFASYIAGFAIFTLGTAFWMFLFGMILFAGGEALRSGTHKAMIMEHLDIEGLSDQKVHYYGYTRSMSRLGSALSALAVGVFAFAGGDYLIIFPATMIPYAIALVLMLTYPKELDGEPSPRPSLKDAWSHTVDSAKSLFRSPGLGKVVVNASWFDAFFRVGKDYLQPIVKAAALSIGVLAAAGDTQKRTFLLVGVVYFVVYMNSLVSSRMSGKLVERSGKLSRTLNLLFWALAAVFLAAGLLYRKDIPVGAIVILFFLYTLYNLRKPAVVGYLSERIPKKQRATILSVSNQLRAIFAGITAPLAGLVADHPDLGVPWVFILGGAVLAVASLALRLKERADR
jgi:MFS family permease